MDYVDGRMVKELLKIYTQTSSVFDPCVILSNSLNIFKIPQNI